MKSPGASDESSCSTHVYFQTTRWTIVLAARLNDTPESAAALEKLCKTYWCPLYAYVRRWGYSVEEAKDLTQGFFQFLLKKEVLAGLSRQGGKFRSFLLTVLKRFLANERAREGCQKRRGGKPFVSIDDTAEIRYQRELADPATPETLFERQWAAALLNQVLLRLREEYAAAGKQALFEKLLSCLPGAQSKVRYAEMAAGLDMNEAAVRMAAHRFRRRYGKLLRAEIALTVSSDKEVDEELQYLRKVVGSP